jgi:chemotaxis signal transduction protein
MNQEVEETVSLLTFLVAREYCAMAYRDIQEVISVQEIVPFPKTPPFIAGITQKRGTIISVLDPAAMLGHNGSSSNGGTLLHVRHDAMDVGVLVRSKLSALSVPAAAMERAARNQRREATAGRGLGTTKLSTEGTVLNVLSAADVVAFFSAVFSS